MDTYRLEELRRRVENSSADLLRRGARGVGNCENAPSIPGLPSQNIRTPKTGQEVEGLRRAFAAEHRGAWTEQLRLTWMRLTRFGLDFLMHPKPLPVVVDCF